MSRETKIAGMAAAAMMRGGIEKRGTSQERGPAVGATCNAPGMRGRATVGKKRNGTMDMSMIASGTPKSATTLDTGRTSKGDARSCAR